MKLLAQGQRKVEVLSDVDSMPSSEKDDHDHYLPRVRRCRAAPDSLMTSLNPTRCVIKTTEENGSGVYGLPSLQIAF